jgi:putative flippase GtrA
LAKLIKRLLKIRIISFMVVGGLGGLVTFSVYYPLTFYFKNSVHFLGQVFYLPAVIPSTIAGITFNYFMNRKWTYRDCKAKSVSLIRYELVGLSTALLDITALFIFVQFAHVSYLIAPVLAAVCMFLIRYFLVNRLVWRTNNAKVVSE